MRLHQRRFAVRHKLCTLRTAQNVLQKEARRAASAVPVDGDDAVPAVRHAAAPRADAVTSFMADARPTAAISKAQRASATAATGGRVRAAAQEDDDELMGVDDDVDNAVPASIRATSTTVSATSNARRGAAAVATAAVADVDGLSDSEVEAQLLSDEDSDGDDDGRRSRKKPTGAKGKSSGKDSGAGASRKPRAPAKPRVTKAAAAKPKARKRGRNDDDDTENDVDGTDGRTAAAPVAGPPVVPSRAALANTLLADMMSRGSTRGRGR